MATKLLKFPKKDTAVSARTALRQWLKQQPSPKGVRVEDRRIRAVPLNRARLEQLRSLAEAPEREESIARGVAITAPRSGAKELNTQQLFGTLFSAFGTYEYMLLRAEFLKRRAAAGPFGQIAVNAQWRRIVTAAQTAFKAGGLSVTESTLNGFVQQLSANGAHLAAVIKLRESAVSVAAVSSLTALTPMVAALIPTVANVSEIIPTASVIPDLCATPIKQGVFTKHLAHSLTLSVKIKYWCPTWSDPFRTCTKRVNIATVTAAVDINVGYKITCCGATAWGQGSAQVCASLFTLKACAGCTGTVTGVAGVSRTPVASGCSYGLGITATLKCVIGGVPVLNVNYSFGWVVTGPCPPAALCA
jgi:hypothetical protein